MLKKWVSLYSVSEKVGVLFFSLFFSWSLKKWMSYFFLESGYNILTENVLR